MHVFINERELGTLNPSGATIGEVLETLGLQIDSREIVTAIDLDGTTFSAGEDERYARRAASGVRRLVVRTQRPEAFVAERRGEMAEMLGLVAAKVEAVAERFRSADERSANGLLATLIEELRLLLILDHQLSLIDGSVPPIRTDEILEIAPALLEAEQRHAWRDLAGLLEARLLPLVQGWSGAGVGAAPVVGAPAAASR
jgi:hypothetical protein